MLRLCICALLAAVAVSAPARAQATADVWYVIVADDGEKLGHASDAYVETEAGRDFVQQQEVYVAEPGADAVRITKRTVFHQDRAGAVFAITASAENGASWTRTQARVEQSRIVVSKQTPSGESAEIAPAPAGLRFDNGEGLLRGWNPARAPRLTFVNFNLEAAGVEDVVIEAAPGPQPDAEGHVIALRRRYADGQLIGAARLTLDRDGRILEIAQPLFNATIRIVTTDRDTALAAHRPYHVTPNAMTRSPYRISTQAGRGHIRYTLGFADGISFALPQTGEQRAAPAAEHVTVDVCAECGPDLPSDQQSLALALQPTAWMQSDDARLVAIAAPVARLDVSDQRKMELLARRTRGYFERMDYSGHYSALEMIARRAGDCTEAAVLLAALGRAAGIPTRVASGLAYAREQYHGVSNAFMPHSWTLAYVDGRWRSFDAALEGFDSTHIALTVSDGDARSIAAAGQLASLLRFDAIAEVRGGEPR